MARTKSDITRMSEDVTSTKVRVAGLSNGAISKIKGLLEPTHSLWWTIFIALLCPANVNQKGKEKTVRNRTGFKRAKLLPVAASFESLVRFRPHAFHFVYKFHSTFDAHDTCSLRYDAMNELKRRGV